MVSYCKYLKDSLATGFRITIFCKGENCLEKTQIPGRLRFMKH